MTTADPHRIPKITLAARRVRLEARDTRMEYKRTGPSPRLRRKKKITETFSEMSYQPSELDPLLPKDKPAPEIHGSRPTSFNGDIGDVEIQRQECVDEAERGVERAPTRKLINNFMTFVLGLCILVSFWFIVLPDDIWREKPKTLEGRVNRILTETPLIGKKYTFHLVTLSS